MHTKKLFKTENSRIIKMVIKFINFEMILEGKKYLYKIDPEGYRIFQKKEEDSEYRQINIFYETALIYIFTTHLIHDFKLDFDRDKLKEAILNRNEFYEFFQEKDYES